MYLSNVRCCLLGILSMYKMRRCVVLNAIAVQHSVARFSAYEIVEYNKQVGLTDLELIAVVGELDTYDKTHKHLLHAVNSNDAISMSHMSTAFNQSVSALGAFIKDKTI